MASPTTTPDVIATSLRDDIARGRLRPGEALRQEELAARFTVSRMPVREALQQLASEGLVAIRPNRGATVLTLTVDELREVFHLRLLVEVDLLGAAVPRMGKEAIEVIRDAARTADRLAATPDWVEGDRLFHRALYLPAGRPRQLDLAMSLRREVERYVSLYRELPSKRQTWLRGHANLIEACARGGAEEARCCLAEHIEGARDFLLARLMGGGAPARLSDGDVQPPPDGRSSLPETRRARGGGGT